MGAAMGKSQSPPDPTDAGEWIGYVRERLTTEQLDFLRSQFEASDVAAGFAMGSGSRLSKRATARLEELWRRWCLDVLATRVELRPGGRAILQHPGAGYRVEIQWVYDHRSRQARIASIHVVADQYLVTGPRLRRMEALPPGDREELRRENWMFWPLKYPLYIDRYLAALNLHLAPRFGRGGSRFLSRLPRRRPKAGQPLDPDFYRRVLSVYEELKAQGHRNPATVIARRMGWNPATVRSYVRRGRRYLGERGGGDGKEG